MNLVNVSKVEVQPPKYVKSELEWKGGAYLITASASLLLSLFMHNVLTIEFFGRFNYVFTVTCVETSLSILLDFDKLPKLGQEGGVLTSMSALGDVLVDRLERTGRFEQYSEVFVDADIGNKKTV